MQRFANMLMRRIGRSGAARRPSWQNTFCLAREPVALANLVWTFGSLAPPNANADTTTRFFCRGWHDWRYKAHASASDEQICSPVYEAIRDYWIDSRLGPGYSPH